MTSLHILPLLLGLVLPVTAQQPSTSKLQELDRLFAAHVAAEKSPGLSVAIVIGGRLVWAKGYGVRSIEAGLPVDTDTRFGIASVTKQFTCACVFLLAEAGKLSVHDPVAKYYADLQRAGDITLLDLMNHTSGFPDYYPLDFVDRRMSRSIDAADLIARYAGKGVALDFEPGTAYSYSNTGYILLGRIIEKVTGEPFAAFLQTRIFDPLGMTRTLYDPDPKTADISKGYVSFALGPPEPNNPEGSGWVSAAGGIYTTPSDLAKWDIALLDGKVVNQESWSLMTRCRRLQNGSLTSYGCGLGVGTRSGRELLSHSGGIDGFSSWNGIVPSMRAAIVLFCNQSGAARPLSAKAIEVILRDPPKSKPTPAPRIAGPKTEDVVKTVFAMMQTGKVDRSLLTADFNDYLTEARLAGAAARLAKFGSPGRVQVKTRRERGGMEVSVTELAFDGQSLDALMYRHPDGSIAQFFVRR